MVFCEKCGAENKEEAKFCVKCGAKMKTEIKKTIISVGAFIVAVMLVAGFGYLGVSRSEEVSRAKVEEQVAEEEVVEQKLEVSGELEVVERIPEENPIENQLSKKITYYQGWVEKIDEYEYNLNGSVVTETYYNQDGLVTDGYTYIYDKAGNELQAMQNWEDSSWLIRESSYDENSNLITRSQYESGNGGFYTYTYNYDDSGNVREELDGKILGIWNCSYGNKGNLLSETHYDPDTYSVDYRIEYTYDDNGNMTSEISWDGENFNNRFDWEYKYDAEGRVIKVIEFNAQGSSGDWIEYIYDTTGNVLTENGYDNEGNLMIQIQYIY